MDLILPSGSVVLFDEQDQDLVFAHRWFPQRTKLVVYARTGSRDGGLYMHRLIMQPRPGFVVDHKNGNGLDNRRANLRVCTQAQNGCNSGKKRQHKRFKGVYLDRRRGLWFAQLFVNRKSFFGGYHPTEIEAAQAYDDLARKNHGEFANLNFPLAGRWL